jgi:predicted ATPase
MDETEMVASEAPRHNLPLQSTSLIGREQELVELARALDQTRLLTLTGVAGIGKTRLALALAQRQGRFYADGAWFVELAPLADEWFVAQAVATTVSVLLAPVTDPVTALVEFFRPRHAFVILDNCEHLLTSCATLADALLRRCAHLQIPATSREPLGVAGELRWRTVTCSADR